MKQLILISPKPIYLLLLLAFPLLSSKVLAQDGNIVVEIVDENDSPLSGVNVFSDDFTYTAVSDEDGQIDITSISKNIALNFSYLGYKHAKYSSAQLKQENIKIKLTPEEKILLPIFVVGRRDDKASDIPYHVENISQGDIKSSQAQHTADALQNNANVFVQKSQMGGGSPIIRGFEANRVLLVVDGVRLNNAIYRSGHLQNAITVDHSALQRIEVINGPGSLTYGSDALGGVVHFRTKDPQLNLGENSKAKGLLFNGNYFGRYSSANQEKTGHLELNFGGKKWAAFSSASFSEFGDLRAGNIRRVEYPNFGKHLYSIERIGNEDVLVDNPNPNIQRNTGYQQFDLMQKLRFQPNDNLYFIANFQYSNSSDIPRYDQLMEPDGQSLKFAEWYYGPQNRTLLSIKTRILKPTAIFDDATIIAARQSIEEDRFQRKTDSNWRESSLVDVEVYSFTADFDKEIGLNGQHNFSYGIDLSHNHISANAFQYDIVQGIIDQNINSRYPSAGSRMTNLGTYLNYRWRDPSERLVYNGGIRYSYSELFGQYSITDPIEWPSSFIDGISAYNKAFTWATGLTYTSFNKWQFRALVATAFRAPNIDDFAKFREKNGFILTPNSNLKPEEAFTTEMTVAKTFGEVQRINNRKSGAQLQLSATAFYTRLNNAIVRQNAMLPDGNIFFISNDDTLNVQANVNSRQAYIYGLSANVLFNFSDRFKFKSSINYTKGRRAFDDIEQGISNLMVPQDHIPPLYGQTSLVYESRKIKLTAIIRYQGKKPVEDYSVSAVNVDPKFGYIYERGGTADNIEYGLIDANGNFLGTYGWTTFNIYGAYKITPNLSLDLAVENIGDIHYRNFASGLSAPGRNLIVALRGSF